MCVSNGGGGAGGHGSRDAGESGSRLPNAASNVLKKRGVKVVGATVVSAHLQAVGVIWSHEEGCFLA